MRHELTPEERERAGHARWARITPEGRIAHLRAVGTGMLRKADELEAEFSVSNVDDSEDQSP